MAVTMVSSSWTKKENDSFRTALSLFPAFCLSRFELMAKHLRRSDVDVKEHYQDMVEDLLENGSSQTALPGKTIGAITQPPVQKTIWKKEEHEWFLIGLRRFARDWYKIAALLVSKNRMQVAIYGHKYFSWESSKMQPVKRRRTNVLNPVHTSMNLASRQETRVHLRSQQQQKSVVERGYFMAWKQWTRVDDKRFEDALVLFPENFPNRFENIAVYLKLPLDDVLGYYDALLHDLDLIESGQVSVDYPDCSSAGEISSQSKHVENDRKRGTPWTEEEHRSFLEGLEIFGRGDWKSIARMNVKSRTATQVASHAQKYFLRQNVESKAKKRSSIHDVTSVDANSVTVPESELDSMMSQQRFGQQIPPEQFHSHGYFPDSI